MSDKTNESGSNATDASKTIDRIQIEVLAFQTLRSIVRNATDNASLEQYCSDSNEVLGDWLTNMEELATSAGIQLGDEPTESTSYLLQLEEQIHTKSEVELADIIRLDNERLQQVFDQLSTVSMPEAVQEHINQMVVSLAEPLPENIAKDAKYEDEKLGRSSTPDFVDAADIIKSIGAESKSMIYSTNRMEARWAKDFLGDACSQKVAELEAAARRGEPIRPSGTNLVGGQSYEMIVRVLNDINLDWDRVAKGLPDATGSLKVEKLYSAYETALTEYWKLLTKIRDGLRLEGVAAVIGTVFQAILDYQHETAEAAGAKIIAETKSLGAEKAAAVMAWTEKTGLKISDAILAARGYDLQAMSK